MIAAALGRHGWALLALSFVLAALYGSPIKDWGLAEAPLWASAALKASCIVVLALIAHTQNAPRRLTIALLFGALGDALLAFETQTAFMAGAAAFLIGHLFYIALFLGAGMGLAAAIAKPARLVPMLLTIVAGIVGTLILLPLGSALLVPLTLYSAILSVMVVSALTLPASAWLAIVGAILFFISDAFVGINIFRPFADPALADASNRIGWMLYWAGQTGLCLGRTHASCESLRRCPISPPPAKSSSAPSATPNSAACKRT